uniref:Uncharacterized protein n=1 Tax=Plectus sambesii TaxID=2011161 RepID=A0A914UJM7_9BILA
MLRGGRQRGAQSGGLGKEVRTSPTPTPTSADDGAGRGHFHYNLIANLPDSDCIPSRRTANSLARRRAHLPEHQVARHHPPDRLERRYVCRSPLPLTFTATQSTVRH